MLAVADKNRQAVGRWHLTIVKQTSCKLKNVLRFWKVLQIEKEFKDLEKDRKLKKFTIFWKNIETWQKYEEKNIFFAKHLLYMRKFHTGNHFI